MIQVDPSEIYLFLNYASDASSSWLVGSSSCGIPAQ